MGKIITLELNYSDARLLQACLGNQVLLEKKNGTTSEHYYFALDMISRIENIFKFKHVSHHIKNK